MTPTQNLPSTRVVALDFLSLLLLAGAAGIAAGVTLGGVALLFATQAEPPAAAGRVIEERLPAAPRGTRELPDAPDEPERDADGQRWLV